MIINGIWLGSVQARDKKRQKRVFKSTDNRTAMSRDYYTQRKETQETMVGTSGDRSIQKQLRDKIKRQEKPLAEST
jgi:hypothetical protein